MNEIREMDCQSQSKKGPENPEVFSMIAFDIPSCAAVS